MATKIPRKLTISQVVNHHPWGYNIHNFSTSIKKYIRGLLHVWSLCIAWEESLFICCVFHMFSQWQKGGHWKADAGNFFSKKALLTYMKKSKSCLCTVCYPPLTYSQNSPLEKKKMAGCSGFCFMAFSSCTHNDRFVELLALCCYFLGQKKILPAGHW